MLELKIFLVKVTIKNSCEEISTMFIRRILLKILKLPFNMLKVIGEPAASKSEQTQTKLI